MQYTSVIFLLSALVAQSAAVVNVKNVVSCQSTPNNGPVPWFGDKIEGASVDHNGNLYAVDMSQTPTDANRTTNTVGRFDPTTKSGSVFYNDPDTTSFFNGIRFVKPRSGAGGRALLADVTNHRVIELAWTTPDPPAVVNVADGGNAKRSIFCANSTILQPNDLATTPDGNHVYLSGQKGAETTGSGDLWHCSADGRTTRLDVMGRTNGIELSPDGNTLYVSEAVGGWVPTASRVWRYPLNPTTGMPTGPKEMLVDFGPLDGSFAVDVDGMRTDTNGALYITRNGAGEVVKVSPSGGVLERYKFPFNSTASLELGGSNGNTMYVVGACPAVGDASSVGCIASVDTDAPGRAWSSLQ